MMRSDFITELRYILELIRDKTITVDNGIERILTYMDESTDRKTNTN